MMTCKVPNLVSVIVPVYNRANFLLDSVQSVHRSDYRPIEVIVVDDGSTVPVEDVVGKDLDSLIDSRFTVRFIRLSQNRGAPVARNEGFRLSSGEFVLYLDSDDCLYPNSISSRVEILEKYPEVSFATCEILHFSNQVPPVAQTIPYFTRGKLPRDYLKVRWFTPTNLFRKVFLEKIGQWNTALVRGQDAEYCLRIGLIGCEFAYTKEPMVLVREDAPHRLSGNAKKVNYESGLEAVVSAFDWYSALENHIWTYHRRNMVSKRAFGVGVASIEGGQIKIARLAFWNGFSRCLYTQYSLYCLVGFFLSYVSSSTLRRIILVKKTV